MSTVHYVVWDPADGAIQWVGKCQPGDVNDQGSQSGYSSQSDPNSGGTKPSTHYVDILDSDTVKLRSGLSGGTTPVSLSAGATYSIPHGGFKRLLIEVEGERTAYFDEPAINSPFEIEFNYSGFYVVTMFTQGATPAAKDSTNVWNVTVS